MSASPRISDSTRTSRHFRFVPDSEVVEQPPLPTQAVECSALRIQVSRHGAGACADRSRSQTDHDCEQHRQWADHCADVHSHADRNHPALVCIGVVSAAAGAFHYTAFDASYAMQVPDSLLPRANGMMQTAWSLSGIVSPALAAFIIGLPALLPQGVALFAKIVALGDGSRLSLPSIRPPPSASPSCYSFTSPRQRAASGDQRH
jgi:hypothetical protein